MDREKCKFDYRNSITKDDCYLYYFDQQKFISTIVFNFKNENEIEEYCSEESNDSFVQLYNREPEWIRGKLLI